MSPDETLYLQSYFQSLTRQIQVYSSIWQGKYQLLCKGLSHLQPPILELVPQVTAGFSGISQNKHVEGDKPWRWATVFFADIDEAGFGLFN